MKSKHYLLTIALFFALILAACSGKSISDTEDIGEKVFSILTDLDQTSWDSYEKNFISFQEFSDLAKNKELIRDKNTRKSMKLVKKDEYNKSLKNLSKKLKSLVMTKVLNGLKLNTKTFHTLSDQKKDLNHV